LPDLRPFRALRYEPSRVGDLAKVVAPPYDVIDQEMRARLVAADPANVVRLDMPVEEAGDGPDDRYRRAARTLAAWRSDGTLRKDPQPSIYVYEQRYRVPGSESERTQRGFFARLRLEAYGSDSGVLPHERTLSGPKEDRYKLLRATGVNTSPVVVLFDDVSGGSEERLAAVAGGQPDVDVTDDDGVCHRMWALPASGDGPASIVAGALLEAAGAGPLTIADGHHRYETALRYRDERRMTRSCDEDPAFDYVLVLMLEATRQDLTVLPTHRLVRRIGSDGAERLLSRTPELFDVESVASSDALVTASSGGDASGGRGRFGLWTRSGGGSSRPVEMPSSRSSQKAARRYDRSTSRCSQRPSTGSPASTGKPWRTARSATRSRRRTPLRLSRRDRAPTRPSCSSRHPSSRSRPSPARVT
jgi:uncharacterized protein (DUF1015 family)